MTEETKLRKVGRIIIGLLILGLGFLFQDIVQNDDGGIPKGSFVILFSSLMEKSGLLLFWLPFVVLSLFNFIMAYYEK